MSFADYEAYLAALSNGDADGFNIIGTGIQSKWNDCWRLQQPAPAIPTVAVKLGQTSTGALNTRDPGDRFALGMTVTTQSSPGTFLIYDRLNHMAGLSGIVTTSQTVGLPTITRYTDTKGVFILVTIYTSIGATQTTLQLTYTDSNGLSGNKTISILFGGTGNREANRAFLIPMPTTDINAFSVETATVGASTGTAGNFGVALIQPIALVTVDADSSNQRTDFLGGGFIGTVGQVFADAHINMLYMPSRGTSLTSSGVLHFGE